MKRLLLPLLLLLPLCPTVAEEPALLFRDPEELRAMRREWASPNPPARISRLLKTADALLTQEPALITDKMRAPASGDKQDYYSIGIYWWPNPITKGKPYIHRDGYYNPESARYDRVKLETFSRETLDLALAGAVTGRRDYFERARRGLHAWLVDPRTRMHPHLRYAQSWPGWMDGTPTGILEGVSFARSVPDAVILMRQAGALPDDEYEAIRTWVTELLRWLEESEAGKSIAAADNNHGCWYDVQRATYLLFLGRDEEARTMLTEVGPRRIGRQIAADGSQPAELKRTKAFDYSLYNLRAMMTLCDLGERVGVDLWAYTGPKGGSLRKALDFLTPYALGKETWPYAQLKGIAPKGLVPLLYKAAPKYRDAGYDAIAHDIEDPPKAEEAPSPAPSPVPAAAVPLE